MAISATYRQLQLAIADELLDRGDLLSPLSDSGLATSPIQNAIQSAIAKWEREPFYFNEIYSQSEFTTVPFQEYYTATDDPNFALFTNILQARVLINSNRYILLPRTWQYIETISVNPNVSSTFPGDFAYFGGTFRLYPIPNAALPITIAGYKRQTPLALDGDTNAWTTEGYDLIRSEAKLILAREVLFDDDLIGRMEMAIYGNPANPQERGYLAALQAETARRAPGRIMPSKF